MLAVSMTADGVVLGDVSSCIAHWQHAMDWARDTGEYAHAAWLLPIVRFARFKQRELGKGKSPAYAWLPAQQGKAPQ